MATVCQSVPGLAEVNYPAGDVHATPVLNLYWHTEPNPIVHGSEQLWLMRVRGELFVALVDDADADKSAADGLIAPIVDAFAATPENRANHALLRPDGSMVDYCEVRDVQPSLILGGYY